MAAATEGATERGGTAAVESTEKDSRNLQSGEEVSGGGEGGGGGTDGSLGVAVRGGSQVEGAAAREGAAGGEAELDVEVVARGIVGETYEAAETVVGVLQRRLIANRQTLVQVLREEVL